MKVYEHVEPKTRTTVERLIAQLKAQSQTLATAESCTGGLLGASITHHAGTSAIYMGGINAYSNELKEAALKVPKDLMIAHGAVSTNVAQAMAEHLRDLSDADWGLGITGVAGPGGGTADKPVGMVCFGIAGKDGTRKSGPNNSQAAGEVRIKPSRKPRWGFVASGRTGAIKRVSALLKGRYHPFLRFFKHRLDQALQHAVRKLELNFQRDMAMIGSTLRVRLEVPNIHQMFKGAFAASERMTIASGSHRT